MQSRREGVAWGAGKHELSSALTGAPLPAAVPSTKGVTATCHLKAARDLQMKATESTFGAVALVWELLLCHATMAVGFCHKNSPDVFTGCKAETEEHWQSNGVCLGDVTAGGARVPLD